MTEPVATVTPQVAVLGTGIMGTGVAHSLLRAELPVRVWNRTFAKAEPLAADGASVHRSAQEAVRGADIVLTTLTDGTAVYQAIEGAAPGLQPGQTWVQSSTVSLESVDELNQLADEYGLMLLDAPVSGTREPAEQGRLTVFASGATAAYGTAQPVLDAIGQRTIRVGEAPGIATRLKLVTNTWLINLVSSAAEALNLASALGVEPETFLGAVADGPLDSRYLQQKSAAVIAGDYTPSFGLDTALKDARLILGAAGVSGTRLDLVSASASRFERAKQAGHGAEDMIATYFAGLPDGGSP